MFDSPQESLRSLIRFSPLAILELNLDDKVILWNKAAEAIFGWTEIEVLGKTNPIIPPDSQSEYENTEREVLAGRTISGRQVRRRHKDGRSIEARLWASAIHKDQKITGIMAIFEDVTRIKESESELRLSEIREQQTKAELGRIEERMRLALDAAKIGCWDWNLVTGELTWSTIASRQLGLPDDCPPSFDLFMKSVHPDDRKAIENAVEAVVYRNVDPEVSYRILWPDGSLHWRSVRGRVVRDASGNAVRMLGVSIDMDNSKAADERLLLQAAALQAAANSIVITDSQGTILWTNPAFSQLTGYSSEEVLGKNPRVLKSGAHGSAFYAELWGQIRAGKIWHGEITNRRKDGSLYTEETTITPLRADGDEITNYIAIKHDVTARKIAEASLRRAEEKYRHIFDDAVIGVFQVTPDGRPVSINRALAQIHGYDSPEELLADVEDVGKQLFVEPDALHRIGEALAKESSTRSAEFQIFKKDGSTRWILANVWPVRDASGKVVLHEGTVEDITERKQTEALLRDKAALQEQLSTVIDTVQGATYSFLMRPDGTMAVPFASPRLYELFETVPDTIKLDATRIFEVIHPDDQTRVQETISHSLSESKLWHEEFRINHPKRGEVWVEAHSLPERQADGSVLWHGFALDVTERKQLESQLRQAQKMESIGRLAGGIAHDFNNMMSIVIGYSDVMTETLQPADPNLPRIAKVRDAACRAAALTRQLLAFGRRQALQPQVLNLNDHIKQLADLIKPLLGEDIQLTLSLDKDLWRVHADPVQIDQVLMNISVNARDAMPNGGKLVIETRNGDMGSCHSELPPGVQPTSFVVISVSDTGVGISEAVMPKIFEPFFTTKGNGRGSGLGLSTVYGIVKQSGGFIGVCSEVGVGTTFKIYLPRDGRDPRAAILNDAATPKPCTPKRILLVEDEVTLREVMGLLLQELGYVVLAAHDGAEASRIADEQGVAIDLLMTDVVMPGMNGRELANRLRANIPSLKVLFISGYTDGTEFPAGDSASGAYFLQKPVMKVDLNHKLQTIFNAEAPK